MLQKHYFLAILALLTLCGAARADDNVRPYAANLFQGNFAQNKEGAVIAPGDRVVVRLWGGDLNAQLSQLKTKEPKAILDSVQANLEPVVAG